MERSVLVCQYRNCLGNGSAAVLAAFQSHPIPQVTVQVSGCLGQCSTGPTVQVQPDFIWYCRVQAEDVPEIMEQHLQQDQPVIRLLHPRFHADLL